jgi:GTP pyrophosphokinase
MSEFGPVTTGADGGDLIRELLCYLRRRRPGADTQLIRRAYEAAACWHQGQLRKSGDPYITHPVAVAMILATTRTGADDEALCAALLHDVVEGTACSLDTLRRDFGPGIADLVAGAAALSSGSLAPLREVDERIVLIKLADRLHNMRTIGHLSESKQVRNSSQTLTYLVPAARAVHAGPIAHELEQLATATLRRHGQLPAGAAGRLLALTVALLPADVRARWREEWLGELSVLGPRRERVRYAAGMMLGTGQMIAALYRPASALKQVLTVVVTAAIPVGGLFAGGWKAITAMAALVLPILATTIWILGSEERTNRLIRLIRSLRSHRAR